MVQSSSGVNNAGRTSKSVTQHRITEDLNPQEHQSTCFEFGCMLRSAIHVLVLVCHLPFSFFHHSILLKLMSKCSCYTVPQGTQRLQEGNFVFHLTPQQATDIASSRDLRPGTKMEYAIQVP